MRTRVRFPPPPPISMPNCVRSWAFFLKSLVPARVRADSCGLRARARTPENARFYSLLAFPRSGLALGKGPEVRKGRDSGPYESTGYGRTNHAVAFQHRLAEEPAPIRRVESDRHPQPTSQAGAAGVRELLRSRTRGKMRAPTKRRARTPTDVSLHPANHSSHSPIRGRPDRSCVFLLRTNGAHLSFCSLGRRDAFAFACLLSLPPRWPAPTMEHKL